jgi:hypothetical protein
MHVGSTAYERLSQRHRMHRYAFRERLTKTLDPLITGVMQHPDAHIELVEAYPCASRAELQAREQYWMDVLRGHGVELVNKNRASRGA